MAPKTFAVLAAASLTIGLAACHDRAQAPAAPAATPQPTATVVKVIEVPTPVASGTAPAVEVMEKPTLCGAEKLQNYLNLIPSATAKEEIAKTLGHNRVRYVGLDEAKASASEGSSRVTAGLGVDGRIKQFTCG